MEIHPASLEDIPYLHLLIESCYRGDSSRKGWTTEADFLDGTRCNPKMLKEHMSRPGAQFLKCVDPSGNIVGCVFTELQNGKMYTGLLCVKPEIQGGGLGKKLMAAVDDLAKEKGCVAVKMYVISRRTELIEWYKRIGFKETGETVPFPVTEDQVDGIPKMHLEFIVLQKVLEFVQL